MRTNWLLAGSCVSLLVVACSGGSGSTEGPFGSSNTVHPPSPATASGTKTIIYMEGSFDPATKELMIAYRKPTGEITSEVTLPYGQGAGDVYLHTAGTHGDGFTNAPFAPPSVSSNEVSWQMSAENGTGATITNFTFVLDSVTPPTVTFAANSTTSPATCNNHGVPPLTPAPCTATFGTVGGSPTVLPSAAFPTPDNVNSMEAIFDDAPNAGGPFTFGAHVTGN